MSPQQVVALNLRVFAIWLSLWAIRYITFIPNNLASNDMNNAVVVSYFIGVGIIIVAILIWFFPMSVANKIVSQSSYKNKFNTRPDEVALVAISVLGLWKIVDSAPALVSYLFQLYLNAGDRSIFSALDAAGKSDLIFMTIELIIAVILVTQAKKIALYILQTYEGKSE
jgi:hypothetical protein